MESNAKYALVGAFVVAFSAALVLTALWLAEIGAERSTNSYIVYFQEQSLSGLQTDSPVTVKGIKVGSVRNFNISPENIERVKVLLEVQADTPVRKNTRAVISRNLLTGLARVELAEGTQDSPPLTMIPQGEDFPVIHEGKTKLEQIADSLPQFVEDSGKIMHRLGGFFSEENSKNLQLILANIAQLSSALSKNSDSLEVALERFAALSEKLAGFSEHLEALTATTNKEVKLVSQDVRTTLADVRLAVQQVQQESAAVGSTVRNNAQVLSTETANISQALSEVAESLSTTLEKYEEPGMLLSKPRAGDLGPGEVIPE